MTSSRLEKLVWPKGPGVGGMLQFPAWALSLACLPLAGLPHPFHEPLALGSNDCPQTHPQGLAPEMTGGVGMQSPGLHPCRLELDPQTPSLTPTGH